MSKDKAKKHESVGWKNAVLEAISCDVDVAVPTRDYESMSPLDCYEAGMLDGGVAVRKTIKDEVSKLLSVYSEPVAWGHPNTSITGRKQALMMVNLEIPSNAQYPELWIPLYAAPQTNPPLYSGGYVEGVIAERNRIVNLLMIQHEAAQDRHHYWLAAAKLVQADVGSEHD